MFASDTLEQKTAVVDRFGELVDDIGCEIADDLIDCLINVFHEGMKEGMSQAAMNRW